MSEKKSLIKMKDVVYEYVRRDEEGNPERLQTALDHIDLTIESGEFIAILGHNGSGKTTLAKHLNALLLPTEGTVWIDGRDTAQEELLWEIRQRAGMVFQNPDNQMVANIVEEEIAFGPENMGIPPKVIKERVQHSLELVGMEDKRMTSPSWLSGGQKQRIAIAGVLAMQPKCIIMDEPTAMLDPQGRREVLEAVRRLNREEHLTILLITHYMEEALYTDRIFVMDRGKIFLKGRPEEIFSDIETMEALGLDVPPAAKLADQLRKGGMPLRGGIISMKELEEELLLLGI